MTKPRPCKIIIEKAKNNYSAYVLELPGCVATGKTTTKTKESIKEAITFHLEGMNKEGLPIPTGIDFTEFCFQANLS